MHSPVTSRKQAGPRVACSEPPPLDGVAPALALDVKVLIVAANASTTPAPVADVAPPGSVRAVDSNRCFTWSGVNHGERLRTSAATPETMAVENDVPDPLP